MSLKEAREKIDSIDAQLVALLKKRMECSLEVAKIKKAEGLPVCHPQREQEILKTVQTEGGEYGDYIRNVYSSILTESRNLQNAFLNENE